MEFGLQCPMIGDCFCHALNDSQRHATSKLVEKPTNKQLKQYPQLVTLKAVSPTKAKDKQTKNRREAKKEPETATEKGTRTETETERVPERVPKSEKGPG